MGNSVRELRSEGRSRGFSLIEQMIALGLIGIVSVSALQALAFCLVWVQRSDQEWEKELEEWNRVQVQMIQERSTEENEEER